MKFKLLLLVFLVLFLNSCANSDNLELKTKSEEQELSQAVAVGIKKGEIPSDFTVVSTDGKVIRLKDFLQQQKPVVVYFMATWCPYCAQDYKVLSNVYQDYEDKVAFISISLDLSEDIPKLIEYRKKYPKLQKTIFAPGQEQILIDYAITKTTTKYGIGKNGTIIYKGLGVFDEGQWRAFLDAISK